MLVTLRGKRIQGNLLAVKSCHFLFQKKVMYLPNATTLQSSHLKQAKNAHCMLSNIIFCFFFLGYSTVKTKDRGITETAPQVVVKGVG